MTPDEARNFLLDKLLLGIDLPEEKEQEAMTVLTDALPISEIQRDVIRAQVIANFEQKKKI